MAKRKRFVQPYDTPAVCHDHFEGSAHCVECGGECKLTGQEMAYTALVRMTLESSTSCYGFINQLKRAGVDADRLVQRAREARDRLNEMFALQERAQSNRTK